MEIALECGGPLEPFRGPLEPFRGPLEPFRGPLEPFRGLGFMRQFGPDEALILVCPGMAEPPHEYIYSIIDHLEGQGLARRHPRAEGAARRPCDLTPWAAQGVLLMDPPRDRWKKFTALFVRAISAHVAALGRRLICMFWGDGAREFIPAAEAATVYPWPGASPPPESGPQFKAANAALRTAGCRPIEWDPLGYTYAFTDGSCIRNGAPDAEASYAAHVLTGPLKKVEISGRVEPREYALVDPSDPVKGFAPVPGKIVAPTNNRGEYLAWCWILLLLCRGGARGRVRVVSDCNLFIQTMEKWLPARRKKKNACGLKNFDLVCIGESLLATLRTRCLGVVLTHVRSHQKKPPPEASAQDQAFWYGNDRADRLAGSLLDDYENRGGPALVLNAPGALAWHIHGRYNT